MTDALKGKVAVVTGAGRGLGRAHAMAMAAEGAKVVINDLGVAPDGSGAAATVAEEVVKEIKAKGGQAIANYDSVTTAAGGEKIIKTALDAFGRLDILVNNAGFIRDRMVQNMTEEEWDAVIKVPLYGHFFCTKPACIVFRQQKTGGRIINTSSAAGLGNMGQANYSAAKEGIVGFTRTVARDMGKYGVTCNALYPGAATRMTMTPELQAAWQKMRDAGRPVVGDVDLIAPQMKPEYVSPWVVYLASDLSANLNGYVFEVNLGTISIYSIPEPMRTIYKDVDKSGAWTFEELKAIVPNTIARGVVNPAPPVPQK